MAIAHELSWSVSRDGNFQSCKRRYYWDYYGSWRGWERTASEETQRAYLLKKMTRMPMLAGDALHRALAGWFEARQAGRDMPPEQVEEGALAILRSGYKTSRDGEWRRRPSKLTHLAEHHYAEPRIDEESGAAAAYGKRYVERIQAGVRAFFELPELEPVRAADPESYLALEEMGTIELFGTKAYAIPDFAFRDGDELVHIYDWKTGQPREVDRFQLATYVLYAGEKWGTPAEAVRCFDVYLPQGEVVGHAYSADELAQTLARIEGSLATMAELHFDADREEGDRAAFPMVPESDARECATCNYRELCGR